MGDTTSISGQIQLVGKKDGFPYETFFPDALWIAFWLLLFFVSRKFLKSAILTILNRLKHGAGLKVWQFELSSLNVTSQKVLEQNIFDARVDENNEFGKLRFYTYRRHKWVMPVHKIFKSNKEGQLFDVLIYLVPKGNNSLIGVKEVEYFFGKYWGNQIYTAKNRSNGFAIVASAYGSFLCIIKIHFTDGTSKAVYRFIDFEMGDVAPITKENERPT